MAFIQNILSHTLVRFIISGGAAAVVYFLLLYFFTEILWLWYLISSAVAFILSFLVSFVLQKFWTFRDSRLHAHVVWRQLILHVLVAVVTLLINTGILFILVDIAGLWYMFAAFITAFVLGILSFFIYRIFIFNITPHSGFLKTSSVLIATGLYPPDIGGPATYSKLLDEELPRYGIAPIVVSFGSVRRFPKLFRHIAYFMHLIAKSETIQVIYAQDPVSVGLPALCAASVLGKQFIVKIVGDYAWEQFQSRIVKRRTRNARFITPEEFQVEKFDVMTETQRFVERFVARKADAIVVPSNYLKSIVMRWGVPEEKITVIYNAFSLSSVEYSRVEARRRFNVTGTVLLSAGRLVPWKGFATLIECVAELKKDIPDIKLYIAGSGPEREALKLQIAHSKMQNDVFLIGQLAHDELLEYVCVADMFVLNTGYEGFSHQLLEVMALGTPIITTAVGGNTELVENLKTGFLVSYNDKTEIKNAIMQLAKDGALSTRLSAGGAEKAKAFTKEKMLKELIQLF